MVRYAGTFNPEMDERLLNDVVANEVLTDCSRDFIRLSPADITAVVKLALKTSRLCR